MERLQASNPSKAIEPTLERFVFNIIIIHSSSSLWILIKSSLLLTSLRNILIFNRPKQSWLQKMSSKCNNNLYFEQGFFGTG